FGSPLLQTGQAGSLRGTVQTDPALRSQRSDRQPSFGTHSPAASRSRQGRSLFRGISARSPLERYGGPSLQRCGDFCTAPLEIGTPYLDGRESGAAASSIKR